MCGLQNETNTLGYNICVNYFVMSYDWQMSFQLDILFFVHNERFPYITKRNSQVIKEFCGMEIFLTVSNDVINFFVLCKTLSSKCIYFSNLKELINPFL